MQPPPKRKIVGSNPTCSTQLSQRLRSLRKCSLMSSYTCGIPFCGRGMRFVIARGSSSSWTYAIACKAKDRRFESDLLHTNKPNSITITPVIVASYLQLLLEHHHKSQYNSHNCPAGQITPLINLAPLTYQGNYERANITIRCRNAKTRSHCTATCRD